MNSSTRKLALLLVASALVSGCNPFKKEAVKTPVIGERIAVLTGENDISVDPDTAALPFAIPEAAVNEDWAQAGGVPSHSMGHVALGTALATAWQVSIGAGSNKQGRLISAPVVAGGKIYTIDTNGVARAFDVRNGGAIWSTSFGKDRGNKDSNYGGGLAVDGGRVYAANGLGHVAALDAATGAQIWTVKPGGPLRGAPTVADGAVYVTSQDNQIYSLKAADGASNWSNAAALEIAGVFGSGSPAVARGTVIAGFSSGELNAYRFENGRIVWQDALSRTSISTSVASLSDIDASPVIDGNQVFAVGKGGRMVALEINSGQRIWEQNVAGISTPWVVGDWVFVVTDEAKVVAMSRTTGKVRWINELPRWESPKSKKGLIYYSGPILAGSRLILAGSNGTLININPTNGSFQSQTNVGSGVSVPPVVAGNTLYILTDSGRLIAYR